MELQFEKVLVGFEYRPRTNSYKTTLSLGSIYLKDRLTKETVFPVQINNIRKVKFILKLIKIHSKCLSFSIARCWCLLKFMIDFPAVNRNDP